MPLLFLLVVVRVVSPAPVADLLPACAWVRAENDGAGAGFVVHAQKKHLVTCRHLVADRTKVDVIFPWVRAGELVTDKQEYLRNRLRLRELGLLVTGKVLKTSDDLDLALLELESVPPGVKAVTFAPHPPRPGDTLRVVGNRLDLDLVWNMTTGPVRTVGRLTEGYFWRGKKLAVNAGVVIGQLPTEEGDSGGPAFDRRGELAGMASALRRQNPLAAVCISADEIRSFTGLAGPAASDRPRPAEIAETLTRATVWVRPTATDVSLAGTLVEPDLVLTVGKGLAPGDRAGLAFPIRAGAQWVGERTAYRDPLALSLRGCWRGGTVLARDPVRDLALIRLDSPVPGIRAVGLATHLPAVGEPVHAMSHPGGLEFAWVYAGGAVRQRGSVDLAFGGAAKPVPVILFQLPAQAGSPGGPVLNDRGELLGVLAAKESAQLVGYAATADEIVAFLDIARTDRPARTLGGLLARVDARPRRFAEAAARGLGEQGEAHRQAGRLDEARRDCDAAVSLDPGCVAGRLCLARMFDAAGHPADALAELDSAAEKGPFDRGVLLARSELAGRAKEWRKARGDLERVLDVAPADADARQRLVGVLVELGEDAKAAVAVADTLRADPKRLPAVAVDLLAQADGLAKKYPDAPSVPAGWLFRAATAANRPELAELLKRAATARDDAEKLAILRAGLAKIR